MGDFAWLPMSHSGGHQGWPRDASGPPLYPGTQVVPMVLVDSFAPEA
jgi:hypothetical protein